MTPVWVADLAARFWAAAGPPPPVPRDLLGPARAFGVHVATWPGLTVGRVAAFLARQGIATALPDRRLHACLFTVRGHGFVFLDAADPAAERRFSLAHELAHFLRDADAPRRAVTAAVGAAAATVLDGRPATVAERLAALLRGVPLTTHVHLMHRDDAGRPLTPADREAEDAADHLAGELLAPAGLFEGESAEVIRERLGAGFGFPDGAAAGYARTLRPPAWRDPLLARLGIIG